MEYQIIILGEADEDGFDYIGTDEMISLEAIEDDMYDETSFE